MQNLPQSNSLDFQSGQFLPVVMDFSFRQIDNPDCLVDALYDPEVPKAATFFYEAFHGERIVLTPTDRDIFLKAILNPPEPTPRLIAVLHRYGTEEE